MGEGEKVSVLANEQDVHLLREIAKWRRANGIEFFQWRATGRNFGAFTEWKQFRSTPDGQVQFNVSYEPGSESRYPEFYVTSDYKRQSVQALPVRTVTEAVDVLVALGYLPPRFSSAYRAGWEASSLWNNLDPNDPVKVLRHNALFHDPNNISFPAVEPAW